MARAHSNRLAGYLTPPVPDTAGAYSLASLPGALQTARITLDRPVSDSLRSASGSQGPLRSGSASLWLWAASERHAARLCAPLFMTEYDASALRCFTPQTVPGGVHHRQLHDRLHGKTQPERARCREGGLSDRVLRGALA